MGIGCPRRENLKPGSGIGTLSTVREVPLVNQAAAVLFFAAALATLGGCASPAATGPGSFDAESNLTGCVPVFYADGRVARDAATDAPLFVAPAGAASALAPRFNDDGTVCRDAESGAPLHDEVSGGAVIRVLVLAPR